MDSITSLQHQQQLLAPFYSQFPHGQFAKLIDAIISCVGNGKIITIGIGKNETIAIHLAALLSSISFPAIVFSAQNCLHGDIGLIGAGDFVIYLSNSGNTMELLNIGPYIGARAGMTWAIVTNPDAKLAKYCSDMLILPKLDESDPFKTIPTTSVLEFILTINLMIGELIRRCRISIEKYGANHPEGAIGSRIYRKVRDIMIPFGEVSFIHEDTTVQDTLLDICEKRLRCAIVLTADGHFAGLVTDGNIRRYLSKKSADLNNAVSCCINKKPYTVSADDKVYDVLEAIKNNYRLLAGIPVVNEKKEIIGIISQEQIVKFL